MQTEKRVSVGAAPRQLVLDESGKRWSYVSSGERGPGMLLLGAALACERWNQRLVSLFEHTHRVVAPAYPRHARAGAVIDGLVRLLDERGLEKVDVFGHELGAAVAHALVRLHPDRVDRVALAGWGLARTLHRLALASLLSVLRVLPYRTFCARWSRHHRQRSITTGPEREAEALKQLEHALGQHTRASALAELRLMIELSQDAEWFHPRAPAAAHVRALLLHPIDDLWFDRAEQDELAATYPQAQAVRFVWGSHLMGLGPAQSVERKLELFFRPRPAVRPRWGLPMGNQPPVEKSAIGLG